MKDVKKHLINVESEVVAGKKLLNEQTRGLKGAKTRVERDNKRRVMRTVRDAVEEAKVHRDLLEEQATDGPKTRKRKRTSAKRRRKPERQPVRGSSAKSWIKS